MNRNLLKKYAPQARRDFIQAVTDRASYFGLTEEGAEAVTVAGDTALIGGRAFPQKVADQRRRLEARIARRGFDQVMEAVAYTWFNRLVAIRFMELHGYLEHGYRVLSHPAGGALPEILEHADSVDLPGLDPRLVIELKLAGNQDAELYRMLLIAQCNALHKAMPFLFERVDDEMELLLPDNLLHSDSLIRGLVGDIPEEDWQEVEIIGWMYQFYISERKGEVIGKVVASEDIPAATQLFTPNWIVKYLVQNSLGRQWVATYPNSPLREQMEYYIEPAEQTPEVEEQLRAITPTSLDPEELTLLDPACGSGHILVEAYDLFKAIYQERGYPKRDIPRLILTKNLFGLEIDDRAAQLAAFALMMKARADDHRIFRQHIQPNVLSIQESKGLDTKEITEALNAPILKTELPPSGELFEEMVEEKAGLFSKKNLSIKGDICQEDVAQLIELFEHGKTFGSLIQVPETLVEILPSIAQRVEDVSAYGGMFEQAAARSFRPLVQQSTLLSTSFSVISTNPPYLGNKSLPGQLRTIARDVFPEGRSDLFAFFTQRISTLLHSYGVMGLMTPFTWLTIKSYESFRRWLLSQFSITSLIVPEYHAFFESAYVPVCTFTCCKYQLDYCGTYIDLSDFYGEDLQPRKTLEAIQSIECDWKYLSSISDFEHVPGIPIAYSAPHSLLSAFREGTLLHEMVTPRVGMITGDNDRFLRLWHEVSFSKMGIGFRTRDDARRSGLKWFPYQKGGPYRKWFGNHDFVVNWWNDGYDLKTTTNEQGKVPAHAFNDDYIFQPNTNWSKITSGAFSARICGPGHLFDDAGSGVFGNADDLLFIAGFLNSPVAARMLRILNPTLNVQAWNVGTLPLCENMRAKKPRIIEIVQQLHQLAKDDWNDQEVAWEFSEYPLVKYRSEVGRIGNSFAQWCGVCKRRIEQATELEYENCSSFVKAYSLECDLVVESISNSVTLYSPNRKEDIKRLLSYAIGCMLGRYSLDKPGLIYAHSGGEGFDPGEYQTFPADADGIIPITEFEWFVDDAANRLEEFIATAWPSEHLEENLAFIAESLGSRRGEPPRDTIRRYLAAVGSAGFYKHHLSMYKRRPIYWIFSSGKQRAFQGLVYLHRYNAGTLSRMRTEYVIPLQGKIDSRIDQLELDIEAASSTSHQRKLTKERDTLVKHREELRTFDEKLRHYADMRIELDLDDGVKVNYGKFGDLLAEVRTVTGAKADV